MRAGQKCPYVPGQRTILLGALAILVGTALPWAVILGQLLWGSPLAITWTLSAGLMTLAGSAVRWRPIVLVSAALGGGTAVFFAVWQTVRILDRCLSLDCLPGPGLGLLLGGGGVAFYEAARLARGKDRG